MVDDVLNLSPQELNVGFTKPVTFISSALDHAPIHAKPMPISTNHHAGNKVLRETGISVSGTENRRPADVGNFGHSYIQPGKKSDERRR